MGERALQLSREPVVQQQQLRKFWWPTRLRLVATNRNGLMVPKRETTGHEVKNAPNFSMHNRGPQCCSPEDNRKFIRPLVRPPVGHFPGRSLTTCLGSTPVALFGTVRRRPCFSRHLPRLTSARAMEPASPFALGANARFRLIFTS